MDATLAAISEFTAATRYDDLPEAVVAAATEVLVDTLGCLVGGRNCRAVAAGLGLAGEGGGAAEWGTVVGRPGHYPTELPAEVEKVVLHAAPFAWFESGTERERWDPQSRESADHSMPYAFARGLEYGTVDGAAFVNGAWRDPGTLALMQRIVVEPDWERGPKISDVVGCRAELTTTAGQTHVVNVDEPRGHFRNPMTADEITGKTRRLVEPALGNRADAAIEAAWNVRQAPDLNALLSAFLF